MSYPIEKGVPVPPKAGGPGRPCVYPLDTMAVGDSFTAPIEERKALSVRIRYQTKAHGRRYTTRKEGDKVRVWRIEDITNRSTT